MGNQQEAQVRVLDSTFLPSLAMTGARFIPMMSASLRIISHCERVRTCGTVTAVRIFCLKLF